MKSRVPMPRAARERVEISQDFQTWLIQGYYGSGGGEDDGSGDDDGGGNESLLDPVYARTKDFGFDKVSRFDWNLSLIFGFLRRLHQNGNNRIIGFVRLHTIGIFW